MILAGVVCVVALSATAASLVPVVEWDVLTSWDGKEGKIENTGFRPTGAQGGPMVPKAGVASMFPEISADKFGMPVYYASGAGPGDRPYISMEKFSYLDVEDVRIDYGGAFSVAGGGYTIIGYYNLASEWAWTQPAGIGTYYHSDSQNVFLYRKNGIFASRTGMVWNNPGATWGFVREDMLVGDGKQVEAGESFIPVDQWFQFVKILDLQANEVRYYVDGELKLAVPNAVDLLGDNYYYWNAADVLGVIGAVETSNRFTNGVGFSYFAAYNGVLTDGEIKESYAYLTGVPEPATMSLLALGGLALLRRKR